MGSDESHFNVSEGNDRQSHRTVSTNHILFEEKGEPKRYRTGSSQLPEPNAALPARPNRLTESDARSVYQMSGCQCSGGKVTTVIADYHMTESARDAG